MEAEGIGIFCWPTGVSKWVVGQQKGDSSKLLQRPLAVDLELCRSPVIGMKLLWQWREILADEEIYQLDLKREQPGSTGRVNDLGWASCHKGQCHWSVWHSPDALAWEVWKGELRGQTWVRSMCQLLRVHCRLQPSRSPTATAQVIFPQMYAK